MSGRDAKDECFSCKKEARTYICRGCSKDYCSKCLAKHDQELSKQLDQIENDHDQFRQRLVQLKENIKEHILIREVDQWETDSIKMIKRTANECRENLMHQITKCLLKLENRWNDAAQELRQNREENEFNENDLEKLKQKLNRLKEELDKPTNLTIDKQSSSFINKITVSIPVDKDRRWKKTGITIAGENRQGDQSNQLCYPHAISIDDEQTIYVADCGNNRIVEWKHNATNGRVVAGGNGQGDQTNQLDHPTDVMIDHKTDSLIIADSGNRRVVRWSRQNTTNGEIIISNIDCSRLAMDKKGSIYVSDHVKDEVSRWRRSEKGEGTIVAGGNGKGRGLHQLNCPTFIFVDEDFALYVSDYSNHRVMKWPKHATEGIVVAGRNDQTENLRQLSSPLGLIVDQLGQIYVTDFDNHRIMRWCQGSKEGTVILGGNGEGSQSNRFNQPIGLSFDRHGNFYVADSCNNRIQKFEVE